MCAILLDLKMAKMKTIECRKIAKEKEALKTISVVAPITTKELWELEVMSLPLLEMWSSPLIVKSLG